jgi:hypothetical protein
MFVAEVRNGGERQGRGGASFVSLGDVTIVIRKASL